MKKTQSLAGYIRERLAQYEDRLAIGIRQEVILEELAQAGYETTIYTLRTLLSRARKQRDAAVQKAAETGVSSPAPAAAKPEKKTANPLTKSAGFDTSVLKNQTDQDLI